MDDKKPVPWKPIKAERGDLRIKYASGKSWNKGYTTLKACRFLAKRATAQATTVEITVTFVVATAQVEGVNYNKHAIHKWTRESGWTVTYSMTNDGYLY